MTIFRKVPDLAHSILDVATGVSVADEWEEIRAFQPILEWRRIIEPAGFNDTHPYYMGRGDTTIDEMMWFHKDSLYHVFISVSFGSNGDAQIYKTWLDRRATVFCPANVEQDIESNN